MSKQKQQDNNDKELAFLKEQLGLDNPSPDELRSALKELASRKVISNFSIKSNKE